MIRITGYGVIAEKPRVGKLGQNFSVHPVGKTIRWIEKLKTPFMMGSTSSITMQSLGKIVQCTPAVGAKTCLYVCFFVTFRGRRAVHSRGAPLEQALHCCL